MIGFGKFVDWFDVVTVLVSFNVVVDFALYVDLFGRHFVMECWFIALFTYVKVMSGPWIWLKTFDAYPHVVLLIFRVWW